MAEIELGLNLYDVNKQLMNTKYPLAESSINNHIAEIASWFSYERDTYFMLLCHERRDYTLIHFLDKSKRCYAGSQELLEALQNRGEILAIDYEERVYSIWLKIEDDSFLYHLFPYDAGVIEV